MPTVTPVELDKLIRGFALLYAPVRVLVVIELE
jgi:hypothetical protein